MDETEPIPQRRRQRAGLGRCADECKAGQIEFHRSCGRSLPDDEIQLEILHRRIQRLFNRGRQAMDFVDEQDVLFLKVREDGGEVPGMGQNQTRSRP